MSIETLEPTLTKGDLRVLQVVPAAWHWDREVQPRTIWELAEDLNTFDLIDLLTQLKGLAHFGYVIDRSASRWDRPKLWQRLAKGDEAVATPRPERRTG